MVSDNTFEKVMNMLQEVYEKKVSRNVMKLYKVIFDKNFNDDQLMEVTYKLIENRVYPTFPKVAEFIEMGKPSRIDIESKALIQANILKNAIRSIGGRQSVAFEDYLIHKIINDNYGSWSAICKLQMEELETFLKWEFPRHYKTLSEYKYLDVPIYLTGATESANEWLSGCVTIKYIGNKENTLKWQRALAKRNQIDDKKLINLGLVNKIRIEAPKEKLDWEEHSKKVLKPMSEFKEKFSIKDEVEKTNPNKGVTFTKEQLLKKINSI